MTESSFCPNCGERISAQARFCASCGARQDEFELPEGAEDRPAPTFPTEAVIRAVPPPAPVVEEPAQPPPPAQTFQERVGRVDPHAAELSGLLKERLALPGIVAALIAGSAAAGIVLVAGLVIAVIATDQTIVGRAGIGVSLLTETFRQAAGTLLAPMVEPSGLLIAGTRRIHPMILLAIPLTALAFTTRWQIHRTEGAPPLARLAWALVVAVPFSLLMLAFAIVGGETEATQISVSAGNTFALGILWGVLGGLIGAATKLPLRTAITVPPLVRTVFSALAAALRPLALVLIVCTALGLVGWLVQVGADAGDVRAGRSAPAALIEEAVFAPEHGVQLTALAAGAKFRPDALGAIGLPFPVADANDVPGSDGTFRIFAYSGELPAYVLLPALVLLLSLVALGALYAGFAAARAVGAPTVAMAAAWGAITGPAWAIAMAAAVLLAGGLWHGDAADGSVFGVFLFGGAVLGAAGGALSASGGRSVPEAPATGV